MRFSRPDVRSGGLLGIFGQGLVEDTITAWSVGQRVGTNAVTLAGWDERQLAGGGAAQAQTKGRLAAVPALEQYCGHGERCHTGWGATDFEVQMRDARIGLPALSGQVTN